jgi:hypothetical protein
MVGPRGRGIDGWKEWMVDNLISRGVGFVTRIYLILAYLISIILYSLAAVILLVAWIAFPVVLLFAFVNIFINVF